MRSDKHKFGKIHPPGRDRSHQSLFGQEIDILEKIDGSNFSFWLEDGRVVCRSRNNLLTSSDCGKLFQKAYCYATTLEDKLAHEVVYRAEAVCHKRHNVLEYERAPSTGMVLWAIEDRDSMVWDYGQMLVEAGHLGLEVAPRIARVEYTGVSTLDPHIEGDSLLGGPREGVVGRAANGVYVKAVAPSFHEVSGSRPRKKKGNSALEAVQAIEARYATVPRWRKAVQKLRESGELSGDMRDMGGLIKAVYQDVEEEEADSIKEQLFLVFRKQILRASVEGLSTWYRHELASGESVSREGL